MFLKAYRKYKRFEKRFYEGPDWIDLPRRLVEAKYKSPTAMVIFWTYAIYIRWVSASGQALAIAWIFLAYYSVISLRNPIIVLVFLAFSLFIADIAWGFIFRPRLEICRDIPDRARRGTPFKARYRIRNLRSVSCWDIFLDPLKPRGGVRQVSSPASIERLGPGEELSLEASFISNERGKHLFAPPIAESHFPLGLVKWSSKAKQRQHILIYPSFTALQSIGLPPGTKFQNETMSLVSKVGESMDFLGCREFRDGDNPKFIHWRSTAKRGELVVREFREECLSRIALVVDTFFPKQGLLDMAWSKRGIYSNRLEAAISLAAAVAEICSRQDYVIDIFAAGPEVYHFQSGRSLSQLDDILDILATVSFARNEPFELLEPAVLAEIGGIGSAVVILLNWDEKRRNFIRKLRDNGVFVKLVLVSETPRANAAEAMVLSPQIIASGRVSSL